jgi:hypothetical protein
MKPDLLLHSLAAETAQRPRYQDRVRKTILAQLEEGAGLARLEGTQSRRKEEHDGDS